MESILILNSCVYIIIFHGDPKAPIPPKSGVATPIPSTNAYDVSRDRIRALLSRIHAIGPTIDYGGELLTYDRSVVNGFGDI